MAAKGHLIGSFGQKKPRLLHTLSCLAKLGLIMSLLNALEWF
jgi:hypothetical protein